MPRVSGRAADLLVLVALAALAPGCTGEIVIENYLVNMTITELYVRDADTEGWGANRLEDAVLEVGNEPRVAVPARDIDVRVAGEVEEPAFTYETELHDVTVEPGATVRLYFNGSVLDYL